MPELTRVLFFEALDAWGQYPEAFRALPAEERAGLLKEQGYDSLRDLLLHVAAWWEEGMGVIREAIAHPDAAGRNYDLDEFNAATLARFKETPDAEAMAWVELQRQQMVQVLAKLTDRQFRIARVPKWLNYVVLQHLKEHSLNAPRFLTIDILQREWGDYVQDFGQLDEQKQAAFLGKQGFARFRDLAAHIIAWWEQGIEVIESAGSGVPSEEQDVDAFNAAAVERYGKLEEAEVFADYERTRLTLINLIDALPDEVLSKPDVQTWLRADVLQHYYEHSL